MNIFAKKVGLGIDVSNHHIRFVQVDGRGRVLFKKELLLPEGLVVDEKIVDEKALAKLLATEEKKLPFFEQGIETALLIPDSRVFSTSFFVASGVKGEELISEAKGKAQKEIPVPFDRCAITVTQDEKEDQGTRTILYTVEKEIVDQKVALFSSETFAISCVETNSNAVFRTVDHYIEEAQEVEGDLIGIVDIGHSWSTVSLFTQSGEQVFSRTLSHTNKNQSGKMRFVLSQAVVDRILETVSEVVLYFGQQKKAISLVVLAGVEAAQKRMISTIKKQKGISFSLKPIGSCVEVEGMNASEVHVYGAALGAALRSVRPSKYQNEHNFI
jgi:Tfp pilus assembly PilM family ATPase